MDQPSDSSFLRRARADLDSLEARSQLRRLEIVRGINFCSNDYLGLSTDARLREAVTAALAGGSPTGSTGSRLLSGHALIWDELESELAQWGGAEAALYFNSGYAANTGLFSCVLQRDDVVFSDSANHASIIDGIRLSGARKVIFPHLDLNVLEDELRRAAPGPGQKFIAVESVFSMDGDRAPITGLLADNSGRGAGVELRLHGCNPDQAEAAARRLGFTVLAPAADKPHGLREAYLLDGDGYIWVADVRRK